jgi:tRNA-uridine 2-sulfurtransferase
MKALVLFSGGLDSRLVVKLLQEQGNEVEAVFFKLSFGGGCCKDVMCSFKFSQSNEVKLHIIDCTKGKNLEEYLQIVKKPKYGYGTGINPCIDCKLFMFKKAEKLRKKIKADFLATGEVIGQRPMSQTNRAFSIVDEQVPGIKRPLIELGISGRKRDRQIALAEKFKITFPSPAGGCLLCEKELAKRFKFLIEKNLIDEKALALAKIGRHFYIDGCWFVVARNEQESTIIEQYKSIIESDKGKPAVYYNISSPKNKEKAKELQEAYSTGKEDLRSRFENWKI